MHTLHTHLYAAQNEIECFFNYAWHKNFLKFKMSYAIAIYLEHSLIEITVWTMFYKQNYANGGDNSQLK